MNNFIANQRSLSVVAGEHTDNGWTQVEQIHNRVLNFLKNKHINCDTTNLLTLFRSFLKDREQAQGLS
jgi:hypothetical protein